MKSTKEQAQELRSNLKKEGYPAKMVSVRMRYIGYDTAIDVTIKDIAVNFDKVQKMAEKYEYISHDQFGEILAGGNTYVNVKLDYDMIEEGEKQYYKEAAEIIGKKDGEVQTIRKNGDVRLLYIPKEANRSGLDYVKIQNATGGSAVGSKEELAKALYLFDNTGNFSRRCG